MKIFPGRRLSNRHAECCSISSAMGRVVWKVAVESPLVGGRSQWELERSKLVKCHYVSETASLYYQTHPWNHRTTIHHNFCREGGYQLSPSWTIVIQTGRYNQTHPTKSVPEPETAAITPKGDSRLPTEHPHILCPSPSSHHRSPPSFLPSFILGHCQCHLPHSSTHTGGR